MLFFCTIDGIKNDHPYSIFTFSRGWAKIANKGSMPLMLKYIQKDGYPGITKQKRSHEKPLSTYYKIIAPPKQKGGEKIFIAPHVHLPKAY